jgi:phosphate transport system substrate-binding protein
MGSLISETRGRRRSSVVAQVRNGEIAERKDGQWRGRRRTRLGAVLLLVASVLLTPGVASAASTPVSGGGSSFAAPEIQQWIADTNSATGLTVNYASSSSQFGRFEYAAGVLQYGVSDLPYTAHDGNALTQAKEAHPFVYVPITAGGLAFMYNIQINGTRFTGLNLTRQDVCQIFTGAVTNWDQLSSTPGDTALAAVNQPITTVVHADSAGESYVLSQFCIAVDPADWATFQNFVDSNGAAEGGLGWQGDPGMAAGQPIENWPRWRILARRLRRGDLQLR